MSTLRLPVPNLNPSTPSSKERDFCEGIGTDSATAVRSREPKPLGKSASTEHSAGDTIEAHGDGLKFGPYTVIEHLGRGGMGHVFKARHDLLKRIAALKTIRMGLFEDDAMVTRFLREVEVLGQLKHPNIVAAENADRQGDEYFLVMEYVEGTTFTKQIRFAEAPLPLKDICDWVAQAATGLGYAHRKGIVHRDVKPDNLMLSHDGVVKVLDLGLAKYVQDGGSVTSAGSIMGTCDYMAPEQWKDVRRVDGRADIYALGCVLYFLCAGRHPYGHKENKLAKMMGHALEPSPSLREARADASPRLESIYQKMTAKDPDDRFGTMEEAASALLDAGREFEDDAEPVASETPIAAGLLKAPGRSWGLRTLAAATLVGVAWAAIAVGFAVFAPKSVAPDRQPDNAERRAASASASASTSKSNPNPTPNPTKTSKAPASTFAESIGIKLVRIPAGRFEMGLSRGEAERDVRDMPHINSWVAAEQPNHAVEITKPFWMSAHETTVGQFRRFIDEEKYQTDAERGGQGGQAYDTQGVFKKVPHLSWRSPGFEQSDDHPVVVVSWNDAVKFCEWLSRKDGRARTFMLPTEAQWEYACRAGTTTRYSFGDHPDALAANANFYDAFAKKQLGFPMKTIDADDGQGYSAPVGRFAPNSWGLHDMHGNVWEWCRDAYDPEFYGKSSSLTRDPFNSSFTLHRSMRGGSWSNLIGSCRTTIRSRSFPDQGSHNLGFRVVASESD